MRDNNLLEVERGILPAIDENKMTRDLYHARR